MCVLVHMNKNNRLICECGYVVSGTMILISWFLELQMRVGEVLKTFHTCQFPKEF